MAKVRFKKHPIRNALVCALLALGLVGGGRYGLGLGHGDGKDLLLESESSSQSATAQMQTTASETPAEPATIEPVQEPLPEPSGEDAESAEPATMEPAQESLPELLVEETDNNILLISIRETQIFYKGKEMDLAELEQALLSDYTTDKKVTLDYENAIKSVYDDVRAMLQKNNIELG